jgi:hypothetical protein
VKFPIISDSYGYNEISSHFMLLFPFFSLNCIEKRESLFSMSTDIASLYGIPWNVQSLNIFCTLFFNCIEYVPMYIGYLETYIDQYARLVENKPQHCEFTLFDAFLPLHLFV